VAQRYAGNGFNVPRIIFLALLFANVRGNWVAARWAKDAAEIPPRLNETICDRLADQLPPLVWPVGRYLVFPIAAIEIALLLLALVAPLASGL
jgi:hypothetical protein